MKTLSTAIDLNKGKTGRIINCSTGDKKDVRIIANTY